MQFLAARMALAGIGSPTAEKIGVFVFECRNTGDEENERVALRFLCHV